MNVPYTRMEKIDIFDIRGKNVASMLPVKIPSFISP